ncbi:MAG: NADH-quinone oxidoreductase subunit NuoK [Pseudomonadota bacterium]
MPALTHFLLLSATLFVVGVAGVFMNKRNLLIMLMSIELILLSVSMNFISYSYFIDDLSGQIFVFFILTVAAAEAAIGLAIIVTLYRNAGSVDVDQIRRMRG